MCFFLNSSQLKPLTADKDIECYKTEGVSFLMFFKPEYNNFLYLLWKKTKKVKLEVEGGARIERGYHTYDHMGLGRWWNGRHAKEKIYKFVIPKGSQYYINAERGEMVSERLIYKGTVTPSEDWVKRCVDIYKGTKSYLEHEPGDC